MRNLGGRDVSASKGTLANVYHLKNFGYKPNSSHRQPPRQLIQSILDGIGFHGAAHPIRRLQNPGGQMMFPGGKPNFDESLIKMLNKRMYGSRPSRMPSFFDESSPNDQSIELMPLVGKDINQENVYNLNNALGNHARGHADSGVNLNYDHNTSNFLKNAMGRFLTRPTPYNQQTTMLQHLLEDLYGPGNRRNN